jgi:hypothetical protein
MPKVSAGMAVALLLSMFGVSLRRFAVLVTVGGSLCVAACGGDDERRGGELDGPQVPDDLPPLAAVGPCVGAVIRKCRVQLGSQGDTTNCFIGVQICIEGQWSSCFEEADLEEQIAPEEDESP